MIDRAVWFVSAALLTFVLTRAWLASEAPSTARARGPVRAAPAGADVAAASSRSAGRANAAAPVPGIVLDPPTPWQEHLLRDPEHRLPDQQRIFEALFNPPTAAALHGCEPLLPPVETKVRLRTDARVDRDRMQLGEWKFHAILDGADLDDRARACVAAALPVGVVVTPTHPEHVEPFRGPFDFDLTVSGTKE